MYPKAQSPMLVTFAGISILFKAHPINACLPILLMPEPIVTDVRLEHPLKAYSPIEVIFSGMIIERSPVHPENILSGIEVNPEPIVMFWIDRASLNAFLSAFETESGISRLDIPAHLLNAFERI